MTADLFGVLGAPTLVKLPELVGFSELLDGQRIPVDSDRVQCLAVE